MKIRIILLFYFCYLINCQLSIIGPNELSSLYGNRPIDIIFRTMSDASNFYVHGEVIFENVTKNNDACEPLSIYHQMQIKINFQKISRFYWHMLVVALLFKKQEMPKVQVLQC